MGASPTSPEQHEHPPLRRFAIGTRIDPQRIVRLANLQLGTAEAKRARRKLRLLSLSMFVRSLGWGCGILVMILIVVVVAVVGVVAPISDDTDRWLDFAGTVLAPSWLVSFAAWLYGYWFFGILSPITEFSRKCRVIGRVRRPERETITRSLALFVLQTSGVLGRIFFRAATGRTLNVGVRPDLTNHASSMAKEVILAVPEGGADSLQTDRLRIYDQYIRDVTGLLVIGRIDSIEVARSDRGISFTVSRYAESASSECGPSGAPNNSDDEMRNYLQPFVGQSALDALVSYLVPTLALIVSVIALFIAI